MKSATTTLDSLSWHDGVLLEWRFVSGCRVRGVVELQFSLYPDQIESSERNLVVIRCEGVRRFLVSCDAEELKDYAGSGNVQDAHQRGSVLQVILTGGYIEVEATSFTRRMQLKRRRGRTRT